MRIFEVTYNKMDGTAYGPLQFQINEPGDEGDLFKWWEKWPEYTPEYYAFVQAATTAYWNLPDLSFQFNIHFQDKTNYTIEEVL